MENSARKRSARACTIDGAHLLFDEIPNDASETTEEELSDDKGLIDPNFVPRLFEQLADLELPVQGDGYEENGGKSESNNANDSACAPAKPIKESEIQRKWKNKDEPMVTNPFIMPEGE